MTQRTTPQRLLDSARAIASHPRLQLSDSDQAWLENQMGIVFLEAQRRAEREQRHAAFRATRQARTQRKETDHA